MNAAPFLATDRLGAPVLAAVVIVIGSLVVHYFSTRTAQNQRDRDRLEREREFYSELLAWAGDIADYAVRVDAGFATVVTGSEERMNWIEHLARARLLKDSHDSVLDALTEFLWSVTDFEMAVVKAKSKDHERNGQTADQLDGEPGRDLEGQLGPRILIVNLSERTRAGTRQDVLEMHKALVNAVRKDLGLEKIDRGIYTRDDPSTSSEAASEPPNPEEGGEAEQTAPSGRTSQGSSPDD